MVITEEHTESDQVTTWRLSQFLRCGCDVDLAQRLAESKVDLHQFSNLIEQGCPIEIAGKILL